LLGHAYIALYELTNTYDPSRGVPFAAYLQQSLSFALHTVVRRAWHLHDREVIDSRSTEDHAPMDSSDTLCTRIHSCGDLSQVAEDIEQGVLERLVIERLIGKLTPQQRYVFVHRVLHQDSYTDITAVLGCSPDAARILYYRACRQLRNSLKKESENP